jgi:hypothetical protein
MAFLRRIQHKSLLPSSTSFFFPSGLAGADGPQACSAGDEKRL